MQIVSVLKFNLKEFIMKLSSFGLLCIASFTLFSCATMGGKHRHERGSVVALDSATEAHVCIGSENTTIGKRVQVFDSVCNQETFDDVRRPRTRTVCEKVLRGEAEIIENATEHFSRVRAIGNLALKVGQIIA